MTEQHKPFDPAVPKRLRAAVTAATLSHSTFASPRASDLEQLLERDAYAEQTRLQLADKCATLRGQRNQALSDLASANEQLDHLAERVAAIKGLPVTHHVTNPETGEWYVRVDLLLRALAGDAHTPQERPASAPATVETNPTPNRPQMGVLPLEAAGIFFPGSTPSAIPAEPTDQLVHMWARDEIDNPTGYALCDTGDGANTSIAGKIANSTWQVNCPKCEEIRDRGAEQQVEQYAQSAEYEKWRESEDGAGRGTDDKGA